jgi:FkbM family methyltransferase
VHNLIEKLRRSLLKRRLGRRGCPYLVFPYRGACLLLDARQKTDRLVMLKHKEGRQLDRMRDWLVSRASPTLVDVGANFGLYAVVLGRQLPGLAAHAFEPVDSVRAQLQANLFMNGLRHVAVHACAASDFDGEAVLLREAGGHAGTSRLKAAETPRPGEWEELTVPVRRVDDLVQVRGQPVAVKVDVEGHECAVLRGMPALLSGNDCYLQVEISPLRPDNLAFAVPFLQGLGYRLAERIEVDHIFTRA